MVASELTQYVVTGLLVGGVYALMSIGLALIFGVMRVVNFAQGDFMMLGMYLTYYYAVGLGIDPLLGALVTIPPFFLLGLLLHRVFLARVTGGGDPNREMDAQLILTLGMSLIITNATTMILSPMPRAIRTTYATQAFAVGPLLLNQARTYAFFMALLLPGWFSDFLRGLAAYERYTGASSVLDLLTNHAIGSVLMVIIVIATAIIVWRLRSRASEQQIFNLIMALVLAVTVLIVPMIAPYNQLLLLPAVFLILNS